MPPKPSSAKAALIAAPNVRYVIKVDKDHSVEGVADGLRARGLEIERVLKRFGIVGGHGPSNLRTALSGTPGVSSVREEGSFQLPPMNGAIPQ